MFEATFQLQSIAVLSMCDENLLKQHAGTQEVVLIKCRDGRIIAARILHVDDEYRDVIIRGAPVESGGTAEYCPIGVLPLSEISAIEEP